MKKIILYRLLIFTSFKLCAINISINFDAKNKFNEQDQEGKTELHRLISSLQNQYGPNFVDHLALDHNTAKRAAYLLLQGASTFIIDNVKTGGTPLAYAYGYRRFFPFTYEVIYAGRKVEEYLKEYSFITEENKELLSYYKTLTLFAHDANISINNKPKYE